jgi:DNA-binding beta-propeller fold protein YncE
MFECSSSDFVREGLYSCLVRRKPMSRRQGRIKLGICLLAAIAILTIALAVNTYAQYNGECWAAHYTGVLKIGSAGQPVQLTGFSEPLSLSIDPSDGSCWVADTGMIRVKKLSATGQELFVLDGTSDPPVFTSEPASVAVDTKDGSCWVAVLDTVYKFSSDGKQLLKKAGFNEPIVAVNTNSECWVADSSNARIVRLSSAGEQLQVLTIQDVTQPKSISINLADNSCWVLDPFTHKVVKLSSDGKILLETAAVTSGSAIMSTCLSAASDGGCWVGVMIDMMNDQVVKLSANGKEVLRVDGFSMPSALAADPQDGGCWVADSNGGRIVKLSSGGQETVNIGGISQPKAVAVARMAK